MNNSTFKNILAIDTASSLLSVALQAGNDQLYFEADAQGSHSQILLDIVDYLTKNASIKPHELSLVLCMKGPGSFTGLRIGFASAKGLALALGIPFHPISSLDCMSHPFSVWPGIVMPVIDAKKNAYFYAFYYLGRRLCQDMDTGLSGIKAQIEKIPDFQNNKLEHKILLTGPDAQKLQGELEKYPEFCENITYCLAPGFRFGCARELLAIAMEKEIKTGKEWEPATWARREIPEDFLASPDYIRKSDAELNSEKMCKNV